MADGRNLGQRWEEFRPSKTMLFWSCVACIGLTMIVGFTWGGWVTGGTAKEMVEDAVAGARAELAAAVCVDRFLKASDARAQLASLKESDSWRRGDVIEEAGWVTLPGMKEPVADAADLCAERLMEAKLPAAKATTTDDGTVVKH